MYSGGSSGYSPYGAVDTFERFLAKLCDEYVIHGAKPGPGTLRAGHSEFEGLFPFQHPLPFRAPRASQNRIIAEQHWEDRKTQKPFRIEYEVSQRENTWSKERERKSGQEFFAG